MPSTKKWLNDGLTEMESQCLDQFLAIHSQLTRAPVMSPQKFMLIMADIMTIITKLMAKKYGRPCSKDAVEAELSSINQGRRLKLTTKVTV